MSDTATRVTQAAGLRAIADWLDDHPHIRLHGDLQIIPSSPAAFAVAIRAVADGAPKATVRKNLSDRTATVSRDFDGYTLTVLALRDEVCEQVVVGTETVDVPDDDSPEAHTVAELEQRLTENRAKVPTKRVEQDVLGWDCAPLLSHERLATRGENLAGVADAKATLPHAVISRPDETSVAFGHEGHPA